MGNETGAESTRIERIVLGCVLLDNALFGEVERLREQDFYLAGHRQIFRRMRDLAKSDRPIDMVTLVEEIDRHNEVEAIGGVAYLSSLIDGVPERPSIAHYVTILKSYALRRASAEAGETLQRMARDSSVNPVAIAETATRLAAEIGTPADVLPPQFSEDALALRFSREHADDLRFVDSWGKWLSWDGRLWVPDSTLHVFDRVRTICRAASSECADDVKQRIATRLTSAQTVAAVERLARCDRRQAATALEWDSDPWLLNTPGGIVDLRTGVLRPADPRHYCSKITAVTPGGPCGLWLSFLGRITGEQPELQDFMQRMCGYALSGVTREQALFFCYGSGANGKSVFLNAISGAMGDYAKAASIEAFIASNNEHHPTDIAGLQGARLVTSVETEDGRRWAESKLKALTGGDKISARFMRQDFFEFVPQFKLMIAGNHKPGLRTVDEAMRRRFNLIPFTVTIPASERDTDLTEKLRSEWSGILRWAIEGCIAWQAEGLNAPGIVKDATVSYFASEDTIARWIDDCCVQNRACWASATTLFASWRDWCEKNQEYAGSQKRFSENLDSRGFTQQRTRAARGFSGIGVVTDVTDYQVTPVDARARARTV